MVAFAGTGDVTTAKIFFDSLTLAGMCTIHALYPGSYEETCEIWMLYNIVQEMEV